MFARQHYLNSRGDGFPVLEVAPDREAAEPRFVPLRRTLLSGEVFGPLARLTLTQEFAFARADSDRPIEALYRFPLPGDAAVTGVRVRFGEVEIHTRLAPRAEAEREYEQARQEGRQAALASRESPDVFTLRITGLKPDEPVQVETQYVQLGRREGGGWSLRTPLTIGPRYVRSDELTARHAQGQPLSLLRDPEHRFALDLAINGAESVASPTHALSVQPTGGALSVRLAAGEVLPDRDCILTWRPQADATRPVLIPFVHTDPTGEWTHFLALLAAPERPAPGARLLAREVILLVDHSGSMSGPKWEAADWAVKRSLADLEPADAFSLAVFHSQTTWLSRTLLAGDAGEVRRAGEFLDREKSSGGTELGVALEQALRIPAAAGPRARHVLVITDAQVSDAGRLLRLVDEEAERPDGRRVSVLCIDAAPNDYLARELARRGGGVARFLTSNPQEEDITTALDEVLAEWAAPLWTDLRLEVDRPALQVGDRRPALAEEGWSAVDLGALAAGASTWVAGRAPRSAGRAPRSAGRALRGEGPLALRVRSGEEVLASGTVETVADGDSAIRALVGAGRIVELEYLLHSVRDREGVAEHLRRLGYDPDDVLRAAPSGRRPIYAENVRADAEEALRDLLVRESLAYGLPSAETAFIGVREERGEPVAGVVPVANALPAGWSGGFLSRGRMAMGAMDVSAFLRSAPSPHVLQAREAAPAEGGAPWGMGRRLLSRRREAGRAPATPGEATLYRGSPQPGEPGAEAVLFDARAGDPGGPLPGDIVLYWLEVRLPEAEGGAAVLDEDLALRIYAGDAALERARVRLVDLQRQGGRRPLNIALHPGERLRILLVDPHGAWTAGGPLLEVRVGW